MSDKTNLSGKIPFDLLFSDPGKKLPIPLRNKSAGAPGPASTVPEEPGNTPATSRNTTFSPESESVTSRVKIQYEKLPYPFRNPEEDRTRLRRTVLDYLPTINQNCYRGRRDFDREFRILVAGGGTGDASTFYAVQTAGLPNVRIVYLDLSSASMEIAKKRLRYQAARLKLPQLESIVEFRLGSLLDVDAMGLGRFDLINCSGVLHHLEDPQAGLRALNSALKDDGAMSLMVYGQIGRTSVYWIQDMMRIINENVEDSEVKIRNTNLILKNLPSSHLHVKDGRWVRLESHPTELYDLFLHFRDRAYTFAELIDWLRQADLHLSHVTAHMKPYLIPEYQVGELPRTIRTRFNAMTPYEASCFSELLCGNLNTYEFFSCRRQNASVDLDDWDLVPFFHGDPCYQDTIRTLRSLEEKQDIKSISLPWEAPPRSLSIPVDLSPLARASFPLVDDRRTMKEIVLRLKLRFPGKSETALRKDLLTHWKNLVEFDIIMFRHRSSNLKNLNRSRF